MSRDDSVDSDVSRYAPSWLASAVTHCVGLIALALFTAAAAPQQPSIAVLAEQAEAVDFDEPLPVQPDFDPDDLQRKDEFTPDRVEIIGGDGGEFDDVVPVAGAVDDLPGVTTTPDGIFEMPDGRSGRPAKGLPQQRSNGIKMSDPKAATAVRAALRWLAEHQLPDGGWSFDLSACPACRGQCRNSGHMDRARAAATALALLPFLGAGETHREGSYRKTVTAGLYYLTTHLKVTPQGGSWHEPQGRMYSHGLASIALCEAYAMTYDRTLLAPTQASLQFIAYAQDPIGGGWRYEPRQPGDTSVVGWQIMALKSGYLGHLDVPAATVKKSSDFLNNVQKNSGANYGYTSEGEGLATTAIGALCRMYLGWKKDNPAMERSVAWLGEKGPSATNMYYNYYAGQVMHHWGGAPKEKWEAKLRPLLLESQARQGHEKGSWHFAGGDHGAESGGRLYFTALAALMLEVDYRYMPIVQQQSTEVDFPL